MNSPPVTYHVIYRPGDVREGASDQVVALYATDNPHQVAIEVRAHPEAIAMHLDAYTDQPHQTGAKEWKRLTITS